MSETDRRSGVPREAGKLWLSMLVCLALWLLLAAPRLERSASASPEGARRTAALAILEPLAWVSRSTGVAELAATFERWTGHDPEASPGGEVDIEAVLEDEGIEVPLPEPSRRARGAGSRTKHDSLRTPTRQEPLRIAVIGDSLADGVGDAIERAVQPSHVHVLSLGRIATGLARADYFDWVQTMRNISRRYRPDVTVVMLGGNDKQSVVFPNGDAVISGDPKWGAAYRSRVAQLVEAMGGSHAVWIGLPPVRDRGESALFRDFNRIYASVIDEHPRRARFVDIWETFADDDGDYRAYGRGPSGSVERLRLGDGEHFTAVGYDMIARRVVAALRAWGLPSAALR